MPSIPQSSISANQRQEVHTQCFEMKLMVRAGASAKRVGGSLHTLRFSSFLSDLFTSSGLCGQ